MLEYSEGMRFNGNDKHHAAFVAYFDGLLARLANDDDDDYRSSPRVYLQPDYASGLCHGVPDGGWVMDIDDAIAEIPASLRTTSERRRMLALHGPPAPADDDDPTMMTPELAIYRGDATVLMATLASSRSGLVSDRRDHEDLLGLAVRSGNTACVRALALHLLPHHPPHDAPVVRFHHYQDDLLKTALTRADVPTITALVSTGYSYPSHDHIFAAAQMSRAMYDAMTSRCTLRKARQFRPCRCNNCIGDACDVSLCV